MSSALAIAGVTEVLRDLLNDGLFNHNVTGVVGSTVTVTALPPDRILPATGTERSQINLFLYQVTPNAAWRNTSLPAYDSAGTSRLTNPPLALDLHYLVSAYGAEDLHAEILLGYAMQLLHESPVISRAAIRRALSPSPNTGATLPAALRALAECGLADQLEAIRVTLVAMSSEELSRLWAAFQSHYRPSAAYQISVVLIEAKDPTRSALPVLSRGEVDVASHRERGVVVQGSLLPPYPTLQSVVGLDDQAVARLDDSVTLKGFHLAGTAREVVLENERFDVRQVRPASNVSSEDALEFEVPVALSPDLPVGVYGISAQLVRPGETKSRRTNRLAFLILPQLTGLPFSVARDGAGSASFSVSFRPALREGQSVSLILGERELVPQPFSAPATSLSFAVPDAAVGSHLVRLRIDGIDSPIIDRVAVPPVFLDQRVTIT